MQKIFFFFNLESAKFVPILNVAGNAGGTTIVIRSNARTMIKCHANYTRQLLSRKRYIRSTFSLTKVMIDAIKPIPATAAITHIYRKASL